MDLDEYLCLTLVSEPGEPEADFKARLTAFWTRMLRTRPDDYEKVYAEATKFGVENGRRTRQYLVEAVAADAVAAESAADGLGHEPPDPDDLYSKYEATPPDWFWIEH